MYNNEEELLTDLRSGKEQAYRYLFDHHYQQLCLVAMTYLHDRQEAESVVVDCIFHFWERRETVLPTYPLRRYLAFIVRNRCIDFIRSERTRKRIYGEYANESVLEADTSYSDEIATMIMDAIGRLPDECRQIMIWSRIEGIKREEIAQRLGISINTVKYHLKRGLELMRKDLGARIIALFIAYTSFNASPLPALYFRNVIETEMSYDYGTVRQ